VVNAAASRPAAVIGAGLGGLTAALALQRAGWAVRVYEQATALGEVGAGISISPGACRALASLGVGPALRAASLPVPDVAFAHHRTGALLAGSFDHGRPLDRGFDGARHIHRADLHAILLAAVRAADPDAVRTGQRLVRIEHDAATAQARFADGSQVQTGLLVAADGTRSAVRRLLFDDSPPVFAGQVAYRCLVPRAAAEPFLGAGNAVVTVGPSRIFHRYLLRGGELVNVVGIARVGPGQPRPGDGQEGSWNTTATVAEFAAEFHDFHDDVQGLIACAPPATLIKWALYTRPPLATWQRGPVTLLGDAAHPILPFLGLGAALAIEDGIVLARVLAPVPDAVQAPPDVPAALRTFQALRQDRVERVRVQTLLQGELIQAADPDRGLLARSPSQDASLFDHDPCAVPLPPPAYAHV
jgi:salicylate hydroxylase